MKFPFEAYTRAGSVVTITGYYTGYERPWCGLIDAELEDSKYKQSLTWNNDGSYARQENTPRALDLIDLPGRFIEVSEQT